MMLPFTLLLLQAATTAPKGSVSGTVIDSVTGAPIRKARVGLSNTAEAVITDASGTFRFDQVPPGFRVLFASHPDYPPRRVTSYGRADVTLAPGEQRRGLDLKLSPAATVSGQITDEDGDPIQNCAVLLFNTPNPNIATTDRNGGYVFTAVPAGRYSLEARCPAPTLQPRPYAPPGASTARHQFGYGFRYYPGKIDVHPGQSLSAMNIRMIPQTVSTIDVRVTNLQAAGSLRLNAFLTPDDGGPPMIQDMHLGPVMPRTGQARIDNVPSGRYVLRIRASGSGTILLAKQPVVVEDDTTELAVSITAPMPLAGVITAKDLERPPNRLWLNDVTEPGATFAAEVKPDGSFAFPTMPPGRYRVATDAGPWMQSISFGGEFFEGSEFDLKPGASGRLEIAMSNARGTVSGDVDTGSKRSARIMIMATFLTGGNGAGQIDLDNPTAGNPPHYSFHLSPGRYRIYAVEMLPSRQGFMIENNDTLAALGETVVIRIGADTVKNLKLITAEQIEETDR